MSLITWQDEADTSLAGTLARAGAVAPEHGRPLCPRHFGSATAELAACVHAVGLLVSGGERVTFELLGRRAEKLLGALAEHQPEHEWSRHSPQHATVTVAAADAAALWRALLDAGRPFALANIGHEAAARFRVLQHSR